MADTNTPTNTHDALPATVQKAIRQAKRIITDGYDSDTEGRPSKKARKEHVAKESANKTTVGDELCNIMNNWFYEQNAALQAELKKEQDRSRRLNRRLFLAERTISIQQTANGMIQTELRNVEHVLHEIFEQDFSIRARYVQQVQFDDLPVEELETEEEVWDSDAAEEARRIEHDMDRMFGSDTE